MDNWDCPNKGLSKQRIRYRYVEKCVQSRLECLHCYSDFTTLNTVFTSAPLVIFVFMLNHQDFGGQFHFLGMIGFYSLHAMVLNNVDELSDEEPQDSGAAGSAPKPEAKPKPKAKEKASAKPKPKAVTSKEKSIENTKESTEKKKVSKEVSTEVPKPKSKPKVLKRPAAATSETPAAPSKRPASDTKPEELKVYKYYYKNLDKFGFKINGKESFSDPQLNLDFCDQAEL